MFLSAPSLELNRQGGFLLPFAIFLLVGLSVMALALWRVTASSNISAVQEVISVQSFYAAESGAQRAMASLFFPDDSDRQAIDNRCSTMTLNLNFVDDGLNQCSASVSCVCRYDTASTCDASVNANYGPTGVSAESFYQLTSVGQCGSGSTSAVRTLEVEAYAP
ncbi:PilX N-terminal domain-containing pilus assembly protein [Gilvimarinus sp. DA14]|uniref:PilX N-terminal domain-containing pilus assembly protein n=1 Tax=Gilvimarinus sp. DA14 TaxID=2956798 RepID=UPI0020B6C7C0|nr:PilX N-terminal domain-containing pilus assembly protein [Gilvimarinus sp. DA14]UTF61390.1 MSHA biogenesis protein MshP [Gilvimarinus sp. DA14]